MDPISRRILPVLAVFLASVPSRGLAQRPLTDPRALHKVVLPAPLGSEARAWLEGCGDALRVDYGGFQLVLTNDPAQVPPGARLRDDWNLVRFRGRTLDTTRPGRRGASPDAARAADRIPLPPELGLYVVQFVGPVLDVWRQELEALGATIVQYVPQNAYVIRVAASDVPRLELHAETRRVVQYLGAYLPAYRLAPELEWARRAGRTDALPVTLQLVEGPEIASGLAELRRHVPVLLGEQRVGPYRNVGVLLEPRDLFPLASHPAVFAIELRGAPLVQDERQGQILAGNVSGATPQAPGYLAWLAERGFDATQFAGFSVNVVDNAPDISGHPDLPSSRIVFENNPTNQPPTQGRAHGFFSAQILAGHNDLPGFPYVDPLGYRYGLGISPYAHVGATAIFGTGEFDPLVYEALAYAEGARMSTNSWVFQVSGMYVTRYESTAQLYDYLTRDCQSEAVGNQQYTFFFAAGNRGAMGAGTVGSPALAKNVVAVGSSENYRPEGTDGCGWPPSAADDLRDVAANSSRGPVNAGDGDGRQKPDILAPGIHIQAGVPQSGYLSSGLCNMFWPAGQTLYTWSSGTSHATPAVAGGGTLVRQWFLNRGFPAPTPAMLKGYLLGSAEYMTGVGANDTLPSPNQGMGRVHLGRAFDGVSRILSDQVNVFGASGESVQVAASVADSGLPVRVTLVWTDAPGPTVAAPWVNDLDLTVDIGGSTYLGNGFSGGFSVPGGVADFRNNIESVHLPAGTAGPFVVTVTASAIGGDGVPGNADPTDQDFALLVYNALGTNAPTAAFETAVAAGVAPLTVQFGDLSSGPVTGWLWDFGDGTTSTLASPSHTYAVPGRYDVSLTVFSLEGNDTLLRSGEVRVYEPRRETRGPRF